MYSSDAVNPQKERDALYELFGGNAMGRNAVEKSDVKTLLKASNVATFKMNVGDTIDLNFDDGSAITYRLKAAGSGTTKTLSVSKTYYPRTVVTGFMTVKISAKATWKDRTVEVASAYDGFSSAWARVADHNVEITKSFARDNDYAEIMASGEIEFYWSYPSTDYEEKSYLLGMELDPANRSSAYITVYY